MVKQHIIICEEEYCVQILTQILQTQPKSKPGSETREKNPGVKVEKRGATVGVHCAYSCLNQNFHLPMSSLVLRGPQSRYREPKIEILCLCADRRKIL